MVSQTSPTWDYECFGYITTFMSLEFQYFTFEHWNFQLSNKFFRYFSIISWNHEVLGSIISISMHLIIREIWTLYDWQQFLKSLYDIRLIRVQYQTYSTETCIIHVSDSEVWKLYDWQQFLKSMYGTTRVQYQTCSTETCIILVPISSVPEPK